MPTFNGEQFLRSALESVATQVLEGVEVLVIDDGSVDGSLEIVREFALRFPIEIVSKEHRGNWVTSTNDGIRMAQGEWISFLHQDDGWDASRLTQLRTVVDRVRNVDLIVHDSWFADQDGNFLGNYSPPIPSARVLTSSDVLPALIVQNTIAISSVLVSRKALLEVGLMDEEWRYTADWKLWMALALSGNVYYFPKRLGFFRIHVGSQTAKLSKDPTRFLAEYRHVQDQFSEGLRNISVRAEQYLEAARFNSYLNVVLATAWEFKFGECWRLLARMDIPGYHAMMHFTRSARFWQRIYPRIRSFLFRTKVKSPQPSNNLVS
jgi:glycosyltransferase involved in cell wall biosynthesis